MHQQLLQKMIECVLISPNVSRPKSNTSTTITNIALPLPLECRLKDNYVICTRLQTVVLLLIQDKRREQKKDYSSKSNEILRNNSVHLHISLQRKGRRQTPHISVEENQSRLTLFCSNSISHVCQVNELKLLQSFISTERWVYCKRLILYVNLSESTPALKLSSVFFF